MRLPRSSSVRELTLIVSDSLLHPPSQNIPAETSLCKLYLLVTLFGFGLQLGRKARNTAEKGNPGISQHPRQRAAAATSEQADTDRLS